MNADPVVMSLKARMRNRARELSLPPHVVLQNYAFERFLVRLAASPWKTKLVLKGGLLIAQLHGLASRSTMDMDATLRDAALDEETAVGAVSGICAVNAGDGFEMRVVSCEPIRATDQYGGFRVHFDAALHKMAVHLSVDISTGDVMTPAPVEYVFPGLFSPDSKFRVFGYNRETILAEKLESILSLGVYGTRPRDYYDAWLISRDGIDEERLREAFRATCRHRGTESRIADGAGRLRSIAASEALAGHWKRYARQFPYARDLSYSQVVAAVENLYRLAVGKAESSMHSPVPNESPAARPS
ncbi:MAG: nucleotidyl transferase AbiEii/AbiGii toxin family protein [Kiritimatiellae bacterium]|nr:nucleotidyl transferase AbiEii/AbiGii toxin family protein [Kiritimatiellia bacterium]